MRICSLVPSATEIVVALGLGETLVGRSAECTWPPEVSSLPVVSASRADTSMLSSAEIDATVRRALEQGGSLYVVDGELMEELDPDLVVTQDLCAVCAAPSSEVEALAPVRADTLALDPRTLGEIESSIVRLASALGAADRGKTLAARIREAAEEVSAAVRGRPRPRTFVAEWLDPPFAAGHWVPEMVEAAGGSEVLGRPGERSFETSWAAVSAERPDVVVLAPCGFDLERTLHESAAVPPLEARVVAVDGDAHYSRPGPRVAEGIRQLGHLLHPDAVPDPGLPAALVRDGTVGTPAT
jgi:iron complex transport system substrate-binding protein